MRQRNHNYIILSCLAFFGLGFAAFFAAGCTDNPEAKAAKEMRNQTAEAVQMSVQQKDFDTAHGDTKDLLRGNRSQGLTRDAALLASGNLAVAKGRQLQEDWGLKTLPLYGGVDQLEKILRKTEGLLIEKERIEMILETDEKELAELRQWLEGDSQKEGLRQQFTQANEQMDQLLEQKGAVESEKEKIQQILDQQQSKADDLMRKAELADGDKRLQLENEAFSILLDRKQYYIEAQAAENRIDVLNDKIALAQVRLDGITQAIDETQQRIEAIIHAEPRTTLQKQAEEIDNDISTNRKQLDMIASELAGGINAYRKDADAICAVYEEAMGDFQRVSSYDAAVTARLRAADSAYYAAMTCSAFAKMHKDITGRLQDLVDSTDPTLVSALQSRFSAIYDLNTDYKNKMMAYFDQSLEGYDRAFQQAGRIGNEAKCSILRSQLLAVHSKMQIADVLELFDIANATETGMNELIQKGTELGTCFTQSEAMRVVNEGLDYLPSLPLNMEVFLEQKIQELSAWKRLPVSEQEPAVDESIQKIDELIAQYGEEAQAQLNPLKQEMLSAKERGFKEAIPSFGDPNSF